MDEYLVNAIAAAHATGEKVIVCNCEELPESNDAITFNRYTTGCASNVEGVVLHKGKLGTIAKEDLEAFGKWNRVYANEVYAVLSKPHTSLASRITQPFRNLNFAIDNHWRAFYENVAAALPELKMIRQQAKSLLAKRPDPIYLGDGVLLIVLNDGVTKLFIDGADRSLTPHLAADGYWESWISGPFKTLLQPGMRVVDVGANVGYYSLLACHAVGEHGHVTAIEANPRLAKLIAQSLHVNGFYSRTRTIQCAAWDIQTELEFQVLRSYLGSSSIFMSSEVAALYFDEVQTIRVKASPLDQIIDNRIDYLKIDAEGAEGEILCGAERLLNDCKPMVHIEVAPAFRGREVTGKVIQLLLDMRYESFKFGESGKLERISKEKLLDTAHCDCLFVQRKDALPKGLVV